jgi:hypothetical protein
MAPAVAWSLQRKVTGSRGPMEPQTVDILTHRIPFKAGALAGEGKLHGFSSVAYPYDPAQAARPAHCAARKARRDAKKLAGCRGEFVGGSCRTWARAGARRPRLRSFEVDDEIEAGRLHY